MCRHTDNSVTDFAEVFTFQYSDNVGEVFLQVNVHVIQIEIIIIMIIIS